MSKHKTDKQADEKAAEDRGKTDALMMPLRLGEDARRRGELMDLAIDLAGKAAGFRRSLPGGVVTALADLVRSMNCYYSNLIEGHDTHPIDIERALNDDYSADPRKRNLQLEARTHITVQRWIDDGHITGRAASVEAIRDIHGRFCELLPDDLLWVRDADSRTLARVVGGEWRQRDVQVGRHVAISPGAIPRFLEEFERSYAELGKAEAILSMAAAHHRLLWIHPFLDGTGRVSRLMSHAMLLETLDTGGLWSVSRGLARSVAAYKNHLAGCDLQRRNDLDGRGNLSEEALTEFTRYFLETCLDQVTFMESLMQPDRLRARIMLWAEEETRLNVLPAKAGQVIEAVLYRGQLPRGEVGELLGLTPRHGRRVVASLIERGVLVSESSRAPLRLAFPAALASRWMPGLFPERIGD
jgi:Fic family protein